MVFREWSALCFRSSLLLCTIGHRGSGNPRGHHSQFSIFQMRKLRPEKGNEKRKVILPVSSGDGFKSRPLSGVCPFLRTELELSLLSSDTI